MKHILHNFFDEEVSKRVYELASSTTEKKVSSIPVEDVEIPKSLPIEVDNHVNEFLLLFNAIVSSFENKPLIVIKENKSYTTFIADTSNISKKGKRHTIANIRKNRKSFILELGRDKVKYEIFDVCELFKFNKQIIDIINGVI